MLTLLVFHIRSYGNAECPRQELQKEFVRLTEENQYIEIISQEQLHDHGMDINASALEMTCLLYAEYPNAQYPHLTNKDVLELKSKLQFLLFAFALLFAWSLVLLLKRATVR